MSVNDDRIRWRHMLDAAQEVQLFIADAKRKDLDTDIKLVRALSMSIGIIGEAASRVSEEMQNNTPEISWREIIGMRNFLFHAYFKVDYDILWNTATIAIPELIPHLEKLLSEQT